MGKAKDKSYSESKHRENKHRDDEVTFAEELSDGGERDEIITILENK